MDSHCVHILVNPLGNVRVLWYLALGGNVDYGFQPTPLVQHSLSRVFLM